MHFGKGAGLRPLHPRDCARAARVCRAGAGACGGACPGVSGSSPPLPNLFAPIPPDPLPQRGRGSFWLSFARGYRPLQPRDCAGRYVGLTCGFCQLLDCRKRRPSHPTKSFPLPTGKGATKESGGWRKKQANRGQVEPGARGTQPPIPHRSQKIARPAKPIRSNAQFFLTYAGNCATISLYPVHCAPYTVPSTIPQKKGTSTK